MTLITKGDLRHQRSKFESSGLEQHFSAVEIVSDKNPDTYSRILDRLGVSPDSFLMVGNSIPSDVLPVLEIGAWAIYVPNELTWSHERHPTIPTKNDRFIEVDNLSEIPAVIKEIQDRIQK